MEIATAIAIAIITVGHFTVNGCVCMPGLKTDFTVSEQLVKA